MRFIISICLAVALLLPASAQAIPGHYSKWKDSTHLSWRDLNLGGGNGGSGHKPSAPHVRDHERKHHHRDLLDDPGVEHDNWNDADERARDDHRDDGFPPMRRMRCALYRLEYMTRHGAHTPKPLRRFRGCERWSRDHFYWQRRQEWLSALRSTR